MSVHKSTSKHPRASKSRSATVAKNIHYVDVDTNILKGRRIKRWQVSEIQVSCTPRTSRVQITNTYEAYSVFMLMWDHHLINVQEQVCAIFLNSANEVLGFRCLHTGTATYCNFDVKLLLAICCKLMAQSVIIAHNHPTGRLAPSARDITFTRNIRRAAYELDITVHEHLIISQKGYAVV